MTTADAWFLMDGRSAKAGERAQFVRGALELPEIGDNQVLAEPIYGSFEGNMGHALARSPIDICQLRNEPRVVVGNTGVLRITRVGAKVDTVREGQYAILFPASVLDDYGYPCKIAGYDAPGTMGCMATQIVLKGHEVVPIPANSRYSLKQWAAFSGRYVTAWSNWELAFGVLRLQVDETELPAPHVWGWGGGTTLAELDLARRMGCRTVMMSGNTRRLEEIRQYGITALDRRKFGDLSFDDRRFSTDMNFRRAYLNAESAFLNEVRAMTDGRGVNIFVDHIGTAVLRATMKALGREGVIATAGWREGQVISFLRAVECIDRHQHIHTHYARYRQGIAAVEYAERTGWLPIIDESERVYAFDEIPELAESFLNGDHGSFPLFSIHGEPRT